MLLYQKTTKKASDIIEEVSGLVKDAGNVIWTETEKLYCLKQALRKLYPDVFVPAINTSLVTGASYQYEIPSSLDILEAVKILPNATSQYEDVMFKTESDGDKNYLQLFELYSAGLTIKLIGGARLTIPSSTGSDLDISVDAEDLLITGMKIELYEMLLLDKGKLNQFAAREQEVTEVDVQNMLTSMKRDYISRKGEINAILIMQITRV